jgi:hypothetical protein
MVTFEQRIGSSLVLYISTGGKLDEILHFQVLHVETTFCLLANHGIFFLLN